MWQVLNIVVPRRKTPYTTKELEEKALQEQEQRDSLQEFLNKPISEVFTQR
ncbi:MAG: hypothetical protein NTV24_00320 [Candidatus Woesebacteria bacterium]|nr:hypothetical protein [Candidatus Woesebacteria bacterium]